MGGSVHAIKKNTEALVVVSQETGLSGNAEKPKYRNILVGKPKEKRLLERSRRRRADNIKTDLQK
jgi:hypothetical protein